MDHRVPCQDPAQGPGGERERRQVSGEEPVAGEAISCGLEEASRPVDAYDATATTLRQHLGPVPRTTASVQQPAARAVAPLHDRCPVLLSHLVNRAQLLDVLLGTGIVGRGDLSS